FRVHLLLFILLPFFSFFFFHDTAPTEIYTLSLHDALPISPWRALAKNLGQRRSPVARSAPLCWLARFLSPAGVARRGRRPAAKRDRKSTRLNSSHVSISYAVFCLKKKKTKNNHTTRVNQI